MKVVQFSPHPTILCIDRSIDIQVMGFFKELISIPMYVYPEKWVVMVVVQQVNDFGLVAKSSITEFQLIDQMSCICYSLDKLLIPNIYYICKKLHSSHQYLTNVQCWNRCNHGQNIHPKQKFILMNLLQMSCVITQDQKKSASSLRKKLSRFLVLNIKNLGSE